MFSAIAEGQWNRRLSMLGQLFRYALDSVDLKLTDAEIFRLQKVSPRPLTGESVSAVNRAFARYMMARALFSSVILPKDATNKVVDDLEKSLSELAHLFSLFASPLIVFSISPYPNEFEPHPDDAEKDRQAKLTLRELR